VRLHGEKVVGDDGANATGSHQTDQSDVPQRPKNSREKKYSRGLDNSGNIEGISNSLLAPGDG
jgi:hypothetical protein